MQFSKPTPAHNHKILVLDLDGVVMTHSRALEHIAKRVTRVVRNVVPGNVSQLEAYHINQVLYKSYGHTLLGLRTLYKGDAPTLTEFNSCVYDPYMLEYVHSVRNSPEMEAGKRVVGDLLKLTDEKRVPVFIFSNAPFDWCKACTEALGVGEYFQPENILSSSHPAFHDYLLKPQNELYTSVQDYLAYYYRAEWKEDLNLIFIDDTWSNLVPVIGARGWRPVYLNHGQNARIETNWVKTIYKLKEVEMLLD